MKRPWTTAALCSLSLACAAVVSAQQTPPASTSPAGSGGLQQRRAAPPAAPAPRLPNGQPDLSGVWNGGGPVGDLEQGLAKGDTIPLLPEAKRLMESRQSKDDPEANCLPTGVPRIAPYPWRIVTTRDDKVMYFLFEGNIHSYRQIFMDGRPHPAPADLDPTWYGHSIGRWDGDTLVIDTVGFNDRFWFDFRGHPHTEKLHTIERYTRTDMNTLVNEVTIDDPGAYSRPFKLTFRARLMPDTDLLEYICNENNVDVHKIQGPAGVP